MAAQDSKENFDYHFKILILGDSGVGKSSLLLRFSDNTFNDTCTNTIGVDFKYKYIQVDHSSVKLQLWDTAGQERFRGITSSFYRGAHGVAFVFDVADKASFENVKNWLSDAKLFIAEWAPLILIGNKTDLSRTVTEAEAKKFADENGLQYTETSAKTDSCVSDAFQKLTHNMIQRHDERTRRNTLRDARKVKPTVSRSKPAEKEKPKLSCTIL